MVFYHLHFTQACSVLYTCIHSLRLLACVHPPSCTARHSRLSSHSVLAPTKSCKGKKGDGLTSFPIKLRRFKILSYYTTREGYDLNIRWLPVQKQGKQEQQTESPRITYHNARAPKKRALQEALWEREKAIMSDVWEKSLWKEAEELISLQKLLPSDSAMVLMEKRLGH